jgi:hypothetical protein
MRTPPVNPVRWSVAAGPLPIPALGGAHRLVSPRPVVRSAPAPAPAAVLDRKMVWSLVGMIGCVSTALITLLTMT